MAPSIDGGAMALPRPSEVQYPDWQDTHWRNGPILPASLTDRAGQYTIEQLETLLQPLLVAAPIKPPHRWSARRTVGFAVVTSALLWAAIIFALTEIL
jgi:hypothetical protein